MSESSTPAWQSVSEGETVWAAGAAMLTASLMQFLVPDDYTVHPHWLAPLAIMLALFIYVILHPHRLDKRNRALRYFSLAIIGLVSLANISAATRLVVSLVDGTDTLSASELLITGGSIWLANVIVFSMWYWEFDRGGPTARALALDSEPDFVFPQMMNPELAQASWEPHFADYLYLAFTNATAFSPTDVMPYTRWAKMVMMIQAAASLALAALVVARAVGMFT